MYIYTAGSGAARQQSEMWPKSGCGKQLQIMPEMENCCLDSTYSCLYYPQWRTSCETSCKQGNTHDNLLRFLFLRILPPKLAPTLASHHYYQLSHYLPNSYVSWPTRPFPLCFGWHRIGIEEGLVGVSHWLPHRPFALESRGSIYLWPSTLSPQQTIPCLDYATQIYYLCRALDLAHKNIDLAPLCQSIIVNIFCYD